MPELPPAVLALFAAGVSGMGVASLIAIRRSLKRAREAWSRVGERLHTGPELVESQGRPALQMIAELDSIKITAQASFRPTSPSTSITAVVAGSEPLDIDVRPAKWIDIQIRNWLKPQFVTGDELFDRAFCVTTNDPDVAALWLDESARREIARCHVYRFRLVHGSIRVDGPGGETDEVRLETAMRTAALFARRGESILKRWRQLAHELNAAPPDAERWTATEALAIYCKLAGIPARIMPVRASSPSLRSRGRVFTQVRTRSSAMQPFTLMHGSVPSDLLPRSAPAEPVDATKGFALWTRDLSVTRAAEAMVEQIQARQVVAITADGPHLVAYLRGIELNAQLVTEAGKLLQELSAVVKD